MDFKIRKLKTSDLFTVTGMLKKIAKSGISELMVADYSSESKEKLSDNPVKLGVIVLSTLYENVVDDLILWFADLCGKSKEEFMEMPPETTLDLIEYLSTSDECKSFFLRASALFKKIPGLPSTTKEK